MSLSPVDPYPYGAHWTVSGDIPRFSRPAIGGFNPADVVIELDIAPTTWQLGSGGARVAHFRVGAGNDDLLLQLQTPNLLRLYRYNASNAVVQVGEVSVAALSGRQVVRVRHYGATAGPFTTEFSYRAVADDGWQSLGVRTYNGTLKPIAATTFFLGGSVSAPNFSGAFHGGRILDGATGTPVAVIDPVNYQSGGTVLDPVAGGVWTVAPVAAPVADPYPGTAGGAMSPHWGDNVRLFVWIAIEAGSSMRWGPHANSRLDSGNVWTGAAPSPPTRAATGRLWVDVTCDVLQLETHLGGSSAQGPIIRADAGTATITLRDPRRQYDPLNPDSPWQYMGRTRLGPGTDVVVWAEVLTESRKGVTDYRLHTGTVDTWDEEWQPRPRNRRATVVSSDAVKHLVGLDFGEQSPVGTGDTTTARINRILTHYGWTGPKNLDSSTITEDATTLAQSAWELIGRVADDEIGYVFIDADAVLQFRSRAVWSQMPVPALDVGCAPTLPATTWDIAIDARVSAAGQFLRNIINASRAGGVMQNSRSDSSVTLHGPRGYKRTDLGLQTDARVSTWADFLLIMVGWPRARIESVVLRPSIDQDSWTDVLGLELVRDAVRITWQPDDATSPVQATGRAFGVNHSITFRAWETEISLAMADVFNRVLHWGVHPFDRLDSANVYGIGG